MGLQTTVYGYGGLTKDAVTGAPLGYIRNSPGPTFEITRGVATKVKWVNDLTGPHILPVDPSLMWANPNNVTFVAPWDPYPPGNASAQSPIPVCVHVHGGEVQSTVDGGPDAWFTFNGIHGAAYYTSEPTTGNAAVYPYPNKQPAATIWYHDHALGMTRLNVIAGLAGFYLIRDPADPIAKILPKGKYEVPLAIQDRIFQDNGSLWMDSNGTNPDIHPYWQPEFFGDTIMVNGLVWPNMNVDRAAYRFRILDGSTARFYHLYFSNGMSFKVIGSEGGYLKTPVTVTSLLVAPAERPDIIVDFSSLAPGTKVILMNDANAPFPDGDPVTAETSQIMQFTVTNKVGPKAVPLPSVLNPTLTGSFPNLPAPVKTRNLSLWEIMGPLGPAEILVDGQRYDAPVSELPVQGTTEEWVVVNPTADTHPIHLHLVMFQVVSRQTFDVVPWSDAWLAINHPPDDNSTGLTAPLDHPTYDVPIAPFLTGSPTGAEDIEKGWKDTVRMNPGEVTKIRVRFATATGAAFPFDARVGYGYVWHCHIIDHEDNEMMRPYQVV